MKISPYGLMALAILAISSPTLVLAETENEANEGTSSTSGNQPTTAQTEHEGNDDKSSSYANSNFILFVTIAAIASVLVYSAWKVYKVQRRATSKTLV